MLVNAQIAYIKDKLCALHKDIRKHQNQVLPGSSRDCCSVQTTFWTSSVLWTDFFYDRRKAVMVRDETVAVNCQEEGRRPISKKEVGNKSEQPTPSL